MELSDLNVIIKTQPSVMVCIMLDHLWSTVEYLAVKLDFFVFKQDGGGASSTLLIPNFLERVFVVSGIQGTTPPSLSAACGEYMTS